MHSFRVSNKGLGLCFALFTGFAVQAGPVPSSKPAAYPGWWFTRDLIARSNSSNTEPVWPDDYPSRLDYAAVNIGQLKRTARLAYDEFRAKFPSVVWDTPSGQALKAMIRGWYSDDALTQPNTAGAQDFAAVNQGQLKQVASRFYNVLDAVAYAGPPLQSGHQYPWSKDSSDDQSYALVNLGQLKRVFSFQPTAFSANGDVDQDLLTDGWELQNWGNLRQGTYDDPDKDGSPNYYELLHNTNPTLATAAPSADFYVNPLAAPDNVALFSTIGAALEAAAKAAKTDTSPTPRVIKVASGRYTGAANTQLTRPLKNLLLIGESGAGSTILDGDLMPATGITLDDGGGLVGFTLQNLSGGISVRGNKAWIADSIVENTSSATSASVIVQDAENFVLRDTIIQDGATRGLYLAQASATLRRLVIRRNTTPGGGAALMVDGGSTVLMENCLLIGNAADDVGAAIKMDGAGNDLEISQCTVSDNEGRSGYGAVVLTEDSGLISVTNSVFWNSATSVEFESAPNLLTANHSLVRGGSMGIGNIAEYPRLDEGGYPLADSPVLDRGSVDGIPDHDLDRRPRPQGAGVDIGAFERQMTATELPEWWQIEHFGTMGVSPDADPDQDGATNLEEYNANTDPNDSLNGDIPVLTVVSGQGQQGTSSTFLANPLVVLVTNQKGEASPKVAVRFRAIDPNALLYENTETATGAQTKTKDTDAAGLTKGTVTIYVKP